MATQPGSKSQLSSPPPKTQFEGFTRLGAQAYLRVPGHIPDNGQHDEQSTKDHPDLIILCAWMGASPRPIVKYVAGNVALFPRAHILLLGSTVNDLAFKSVSAQVRDLGPAAKAIKALTNGAKTNDKKFKIFAHIFSNGGSWSICALQLAYARLESGSLPVVAMVLDSAPSLPRVRPGYNAMMEALPKKFLIRLVAGIGFWFLLTVYYIAYKLRLQANIIMTLWNTLNDPKGPFLTPAVPRTYVFSKQDAMVPFEDVLSHAAEAKEILAKAASPRAVDDLVTVEEFTGTHVGHMIVDAQRYWQVVAQTWSRAK